VVVVGMIGGDVMKDWVYWKIPKRVTMLVTLDMMNLLIVDWCYGKRDSLMYLMIVENLCNGLK